VAGAQRRPGLSCEPPADPEAYAFVHQVRVRFAETDAMAVVHHAAYLPYLEAARVEYLRAVGHPYDAIRAGGLDLPVLEVAVRYRKPLRFDELVDVHVVIAEVKGATFQMAYLLRVDGEARATAVTVHGAVKSDGRPVRTPAWLRDLAIPVKSDQAEDYPA
jgi:acyl-CoA thioester hydrolase